MLENMKQLLIFYLIVDLLFTIVGIVSIIRGIVKFCKEKKVRDALYCLIYVVVGSTLLHIALFKDHNSNFLIRVTTGIFDIYTENYEEVTGVVTNVAETRDCVYITIDGGEYTVAYSRYYNMYVGYNVTIKVGKRSHYVVGIVDY